MPTTPRSPLEVFPVSLTGKTVRLEPLSEAHIPDLAHYGCDDDIWRYMAYGYIRSKSEVQAWVQFLLARRDAGTDFPFAVIERRSERAIGSTRYLDIRPNDLGLEIGGTWYGKEFQRTAVNTECKYLLLWHAFEILDCLRVQLKTDQRNLRSQRAIERIGGVKEGILRDHMITGTGYLRSSVYYSILQAEWPAVKTRLEELLSP